jgi:hypothetical protein
VDAIVTVTATTPDADAVRPTSASSAGMAEVIMIDCSGSMGDGKLVAAKAAAGVALDALRDGVTFAVIAGTHTAELVYPFRPGTEVVSPASRSAAKAAIARLHADGGTAMGSWLRLANTVLAADPARIKHALLLTDGKNEHEPVEQLDAALAECAGRFRCDSRGVGHGWRADEIMRVASALLGTADGMKNPADLPADFQAVIAAAMGRTAADVTLRVWTPAGAQVKFLKQMYPDILDLTGRGAPAGARVHDFPTGAWGTESREYHLRVELEPGAIGDELLAARVRVLQGEAELGQGLVEAVWTDDAARSTVINRKVAHYNGQGELAEAIQEGLAARDAGDIELATAKLGAAVRLAHEHGRADTATLLSNVVEVIDPVTGTVRLKSRSDNADLDIDSEIARVGTTRTQRLKPR